MRGSHEFKLIEQKKNTSKSYFVHFVKGNRGECA